MRRFNCAVPDERATGLRVALDTVRSGGLVVLPTDTVYGIGADAFSPQAVADLLAAKGRGRNMPPPVLIGRRDTLDGLATDVSAAARALVDAFWPGGLTVILHAVSTLAWDLGDTRGTVAVRMPLHPVALDLLAETGPMAVSSANRTGQPAPATAEDAHAQLGDAVDVYLDGGPCAGSVPSTMVDCTGPVPRVLRAGVIGAASLREVVPDLESGDAPAG